MNFNQKLNKLSLIVWTKKDVIKEIKENFKLSIQSTNLKEMNDESPYLYDQDNDFK